MASSATIVETKKIAVRSLIVESFRGCGLRLRSPFAVADPVAGESRYINRADGDDSTAPPCPMVVFINSRSGGRHNMVVFINSRNGGRHGPALKERL
ncbi:hypothetical protein ACSQ67_021305 [Phaseolus vulgaris]